MQLEIQLLAERESEAAAFHYERQSDGLGTRFLDELHKAYDLIVQFPNAWTRVGKRVRKIGLNRFPYLVFYAVYHKRIVILAIAPMSRKPFYWKDRLRELQE